MISTHILDLKTGSPAAAVTVVLEKKSKDQWTQVQAAKTNQDGRIAFDNKPETGLFQLTFQIDEYFKQQKLEPFFPTAQISFQITDTKRKYHIPLLLSPFGYSTYRGS